MPRLTESNPAISDPISPTGTVDVKLSLVDRIKAEAFWDKLASIDSQYTPSYLIEHGVTRAALEEIFSLESDFTDGRITYYEFDRALDSRLFLSKLPKILARFRQTLYESCRTQIPRTSLTKLQNFVACTEKQLMMANAHYLQ